MIPIGWRRSYSRWHKPAPCEEGGTVSRHSDEKLVRDFIPRLIRAAGGEPAFRTALPKERLDLLKRKLVEEACECDRADDKLQLLTSLAGLMEVIEAILKESGASVHNLRDLKQSIANEKGTFSAGVVLELDDDMPGVDDSERPA